MVNSEQKSNLAPEAKEVSIYLIRFFEEFRKAHEELAGGTVVKSVNDFINKIENGEQITREEMIQLTQTIGKVKNYLLEEERRKQLENADYDVERGITIIGNFYKKLLNSLGLKEESIAG